MLSFYRRKEIKRDCVRERAGDREREKWRVSLGKRGTVCPGSSDPAEKIFNKFASENEAYTIYKL